MSRKNYSNTSGAARKQTQEIKLMQGKSSANRNSKNTTQTSNVAREQVKSTKISPHKMHLNMANMLSTERMRNEKESFVRTVLTARQ